jgi:Co/Zn/Cd efflux system component
MFYLRRHDVFQESKPLMSMSLFNEIINPSSPVDIEERKSNVNMMSAMTHIGGDSFRTASVFICAVVASTTSISSDLCDAWAAVAVTLSIILFIIPLCKEIYSAATKQDEN